MHVLVSPGSRWARQGCRVVRTPWLPPEHVHPGTPPTTIRERTAWEVASEPDPVEAVAALDVLFRAERPALASMSRWMSAFPDSRAARAIALADPLAESPQESRTRVRLALADFPPPVSQYSIYVNARFVARVDLAWPAAKVAVEYDGAWHGEIVQIPKDRIRSNKLVDSGWEVLYVTSVQLKEPALFEEFCRQLRAALARGGSSG